MRFNGTFTGPRGLPDGTVIQPTGKSFDVFFSTTARWHLGKIVEEYLFYDSATFISAPVIAHPLARQYNPYLWAATTTRLVEIRLLVAVEELLDQSTRQLG